MDIINENVEHPQKVEVVNDISTNVVTSQDNPLVVNLPNTLLTNNRTAVAVVDQGSHQNEIYVHPTNQLKSLYINAVHVLNSGVGYFVPYRLEVLNVNDVKISTVVASVYEQLHEQFPTADISVFFCSTDSSRNYTFDCYNGQ